MKKRILLMIAVSILGAGVAGWAQDTGDLLGQVARIYSGSDSTQSGLIAGYSLWGLIGGLVFSSIGFVAFMYGKKNSEYKPLVIGILLMGYPYVVKGTLMLYLIGVGLIAVLYFFKE